MLFQATSQDSWSCSWYWRPQRASTTIILSLLFCCFGSKLTVGFTGVSILECALNIPRSKGSSSLIDVYNQWLQSQVGVTILRIWPGLPRPSLLASEHWTWQEKRASGGKRLLLDVHCACVWALCCCQVHPAPVFTTLTVKNAECWMFYTGAVQCPDPELQLLVWE